MNELQRIPSYVDMVDALVGMACQYMGCNGQIDHCGDQASETALEILTELGLVKNNELIDEAFDREWLEQRFVNPINSLTTYPQR